MYDERINLILAPTVLIQHGGSQYSVNQRINFELRQEAQLFAESAIRNFKTPIKTKEQVISILEQKRYVPNNWPIRKAQLLKNISDIQLDIFNKFFKDRDRRELERRLKHLRNEMEEFENLIQHMYRTSRDGMLNKIKHDYILEHCIDAPEELKPFIANLYLEKIVNLSNNIRKFARSNDWQCAWGSFGSNVFQFFPPTDLQVTLISYSQFYKSVFEHPEKPHEKIIDHDDALDGWLRDQQIKNKDKKEKNSKPRGNGNRFTFARDESEAKDIYQRNGTHARMTQSARMNHLRKTKEVDGKQFQDHQPFIRKK